LRVNIGLPAAADTNRRTTRAKPEVRSHWNPNSISKLEGGTGRYFSLRGPAYVICCWASKYDRGGKRKTTKKPYRPAAQLSGIFTTHRRVRAIYLRDTKANERPSPQRSKHTDTTRALTHSRPKTGIPLSAFFVCFSFLFYKNKREFTSQRARSLKKYLKSYYLSWQNLCDFPVLHSICIPSFNHFQIDFLN